MMLWGWGVVNSKKISIKRELKDCQMISIVVDDCEWNLSQKVSIKRELKVFFRRLVSLPGDLTLTEDSGLIELRD